MRPWLVLSALIAVAATTPQALRSALVCAASILLESLPYLAAGTIAATFVGARARHLVAYLGCGCGHGPSGRSLPAAAAAAIMFGLPVAISRVVAASAIARIGASAGHADHDSLLEAAGALVPAALLAGAMAAFVPPGAVAAWPAPCAFAAGALLGIVASPCALGGVALAASLHAHSAAAALGVLCTAGIVGMPLPRLVLRDDRAAYVLLAVACAIVAWQHGAALVHPRMTLPLACTAPLCGAYALRTRGRSASALFAACALLAAVVIGAPAPHFAATETTLADAFAGEHLSFSGLAITRDHRTALVRYAITCCRADATPVSVLLDRQVPGARWLRADGVLRTCGIVLCLHAQRLDAIAPPSDPFVYL